MKRAPLHVLFLEDRVVPAISIRFDYTYDVNNFFAEANRRVVLETAINAVASRLDDDLLAIPQAVGGNSWSAGFDNPGTGGSVQLNNITVSRGEMIVYVGARALSGSTIGFASASFNVFGSSGWVNLVSARGQVGALSNTATDVGPWGGSITFNSQTNWGFNTDPTAVPMDQTNFFITAQHEFGHLLGFGASDSWDALIRSNGTFVGAASQALFGGPLPLADAGHLADGLLFDGNPIVMSATQDTSAAVGVGFTRLDFAGLSDIGWQVNDGSVSPPTSPPNNPPGNVPPIVPVVPGTPPTTPPNTPTVPITPLVPPTGVGFPYVVGSGNNADPQYQVRLGNGTVTRTGSAFDGSVTGGLRVASADVNGDGVPDIILGAGPGSEPRVSVIDGATGNELYQFLAFESSFRGGIYVAAGDFNGDGNADLVITPDEGGGPRVQIRSGLNGGVLADFFGIDDPNFFGGARAATGDINNDGRADLLLGAGFGGGPRVAIFDGSSILSNGRGKLFGDFFVFEQSLRNGVFLTSGDLNRDGRAELIAGGGPGGGPRILALSGADLTNGRTPTQIANFFAGDSNQRGGVRLASRDLTGDGASELIVGSGEGTAAIVSLYDGASMSLLQNITIGGGLGVYVG